MVHLRALPRLASSDIREYYPRSARHAIPSHLNSYTPRLSSPPAGIELPGCQFRHSQESAIGASRPSQERKVDHVPTGCIQLSKNRQKPDEAVPKLCWNSLLSSALWPKNVLSGHKAVGRGYASFPRTAQGNYALPAGPRLDDIGRKWTVFRFFRRRRRLLARSRPVPRADGGSALQPGDRACGRGKPS
jgi:hypothetical protein